MSAAVRPGGSELDRDRDDEPAPHGPECPGSWRQGQDDESPLVALGPIAALIESLMRLPSDERAARMRHPSFLSRLT